MSLLPCIATVLSPFGSVSLKYSRTDKSSREQRHIYMCHGRTLDLIIMFITKLLYMLFVL